MSCRVANLRYHRWVDPIEQAGEDRLSRLPHDHENRRCDQEANDRVSKRVAQPHPDCPKQDSKARPAIRPGVVPISHKGSAFDFPTNPDTKNGNSLIASKPDYRGHHDGPQVSHRLGIEESVYGLVTGDYGAKKDDEHYDYPCQVLKAPIAKGKAPARPQPSERKGDPQRHRGCRITEVMNSV